MAGVRGPGICSSNARNVRAPGGTGGTLSAGNHCVWPGRAADVARRRRNRLPEEHTSGAKVVAVEHVDLASRSVDAAGDLVLLPSACAAAVPRVDGKADEGAAFLVRDWSGVEHSHASFRGGGPGTGVAAASFLPGCERREQLLLDQRLGGLRRSRSGGEQEDEKGETAGHVSSRRRVRRPAHWPAPATRARSGRRASDRRRGYRSRRASPA